MIKWNSKKTYTEADIAKMQQEAEKRVHDFQSRTTDNFFFEPPSQLIANQRMRTEPAVVYPSPNAYSQMDPEDFERSYREYYGEHNTDHQIPMAGPSLPFYSGNASMMPNEAAPFDNAAQPDASPNPVTYLENNNASQWENSANPNEYHIPSPQENYVQTVDSDLLDNTQPDVPADGEDPISGLLDRFNLDKDMVIIMGLMYLLYSEKADTSLLMGLAYLLL